MVQESLGRKGFHLIGGPGKHSRQARHRGYLAMAKEGIGGTAVSDVENFSFLFGFLMGMGLMAILLVILVKILSG